jgi:fructose-specific phosphotransferase system IIA component
MDKLEVCAYLSPERVLDLPPTDKQQLLEKLADLVVAAPGVRDPEAVKKALFAREKTMSTGIGEGIAIPHARTASVDDFVVAFARVKAGVEYESPDQKPVKLVFMIVANESQDKMYIKLLSRLMLRMRSSELVQNLLDAEGPAGLYRVLVETK